MSMTTQEKIDRLNTIIEREEIKNFRAEELGRLLNPKWEGERFMLPNKEDLENIVFTLAIAQAVRDVMGEPVHVVSGYRPPEYNALVGGSPGSQHMQFRALDIKPDNPERLGEMVFWAHISMFHALQYPGNKGHERGAVLTYPNDGFVHIDFGGRDNNFFKIYT